MANLYKTIIYVKPSLVSRKPGIYNTNGESALIPGAVASLGSHN